MFGSTILEVAVGLVLVYLVLGLICAAVNEWIAQLLALRAKTLVAGIRHLLDEGLTERLYAHPLIDGLAKRGRFDRATRQPSRPSYIPANLFSLTLFDVLAPADPAKGPHSLAEVRSAIAALPDERVKQTLLPLLAEAGDDLATARLAIERWFDEGMDRVSGQYKRRIQIVTIVLALVLTSLANADSIRLANEFSRDDVLRAAIVRLAEETVEQGSLFVTPEAVPTDTAQQSDPVATPVVPTATGPSNLDEARVERLVEQTAELELPIGWSDPDLRPKGFDAAAWLGKILGLLATTAAVSLGAPFWFDTLSKFVRVRTAGARPAPVPERPPSSASPARGPMERRER